MAEINGFPNAGHAIVDVAQMPDGEPAVSITGINSPHRFRTQPVRDARSFVVPAGRYLLDVDCMRPGARVIVDGNFDFVTTVEADKHYLLDCAPSRDTPENGFHIISRGD